MSIIAISKSLHGLKANLENLGYEVIFDDEIKTPVDVYIYVKDGSQPTLYSTNQMLSNVAFSDPFAMSQHVGTLLINGKDKSVEEIQYIIENKVYSPIF